MLGWFELKGCEAFAAQFAQEVVNQVGKLDASAKRRGKQVAKLQRLFETVRKFSEAENLNFYKKAKLAQSLSHSLVEAGYPQEFVEQVVHLAMEELTAAG